MRVILTRPPISYFIRYEGCLFSIVIRLKNNRHSKIIPGKKVGFQLGIRCYVMRRLMQTMLKQ